MAKRKVEEAAPATPDAAGAPAASASAVTATWAPAGPLSRVSLGVIIAAVVLFNLPLLHYYLFRATPAAPLTLPYQNDFSNPGSVESDFFSTGGLWRVDNGQLMSPGVKNNPLWLKASLPQNVAVEFDVRSLSPEGDVKVELFGDGSDHASGYVFIHGGWNNSLSIIARLDEHGPALGALQAQTQGRGLVESGLYRDNTRVRVEANPFKVELGRTYHWRIERRGSLIVWFIDHQEFMRFDDPLPLAGKGHDRFAFSSWEAQLYFDNLRVQAL
jgi:hypothetical protein